MALYKFALIIIITVAAIIKTHIITMLTFKVVANVCKAKVREKGHF